MSRSEVPRCACVATACGGSERTIGVGGYSTLAELRVTERLAGHRNLMRSRRHCSGKAIRPLRKAILFNGFDRAYASVEWRRRVRVS